MTHLSRKHTIFQLVFFLVMVTATAGLLNAQTNSDSRTTNASEAPSVSIPVLQIKADQVTAHFSPILYGLMTEEINYSYEGGLYGELIRNRTFKANPTNAVYWSSLNGAISLDTNQPLNPALDLSLKLDTGKATEKTPVGIVNNGYWGIPVKPNTTYHASFYAKAKNFNGTLTVSLVHVVNTNQVTINSSPGSRFFLGALTQPVATATIPKVSSKWQKYEVTLTTGEVSPSKENQLVISTTKSGTFWHRHGTIWFQQVSLFPPTWNNRPNGNRIDIMQLLADMQPKFLRFPGGNYLEGNTISERFNWKETLGDISQRPGHRSPWGYWSTDGFGLLEFLEWCEDLHMQPVLAVYAGYSLRQQHIEPGLKLEPYVHDALDEIEYVTGDSNTRWGGQRAKDGHPAPFPLTYIEIGNEDWFDRSGSYNGRFAQFFEAIKAKYPNLQVIATAPVTSREPDLIDEHYYRSQEAMEAQAHQYDNRPRSGKTRVFDGEWATRVGSPTPNLAGALGDAAWLTGLERNSDLVVMASYAPLFVNVSELTGADHSIQWRTDLIGYDTLTSYGSPSYYVQKMFNTHHGDQVLVTDSQGIPTYAWRPPARRRNGVEQPRPPEQQVPTLFFNATRDSASGLIYLKIVNRLGTSQSVKIEISGVSNIEPEGTAIVLQGDSPDVTNSLQEPTKIVPVTESANGLGVSFTRDFPPFSITILELKTK